MLLFLVCYRFSDVLSSSIALLYFLLAFSYPSFSTLILFGVFVFFCLSFFDQYSFKLNSVLYSISRDIIVEALSVSVCVSRVSTAGAGIASVNREKKYMLRPGKPWRAAVLLNPQDTPRSHKL